MTGVEIAVVFSVDSGVSLCCTLSVILTSFSGEINLDSLNSTFSSGFGWWDSTTSSLETSCDLVDSNLESIHSTFDSVEVTWKLDDSVDFTFDSVDLRFASVNSTFDSVDSTCESINSIFDFSNSISDSANSTFESINSISDWSNSTSDPVNSTFDVIPSETVNSMLNFLDSTPCKSIETSCDSVDSTLCNSIECFRDSVEISLFETDFRWGDSVEIVSPEFSSDWEELLDSLSSTFSVTSSESFEKSFEIDSDSMDLVESTLLESNSVSSTTFERPEILAEYSLWASEFVEISSDADKSTSGSIKTSWGLFDTDGFLSDSINFGILDLAKSISSDEIWLDFLLLSNSTIWAFNSASSLRDSDSVKFLGFPNSSPGLSKVSDNGLNSTCCSSESERSVFESGEEAFFDLAIADLTAFPVPAPIAAAPNAGKTTTDAAAAPRAKAEVFRAFLVHCLALSDLLGPASSDSVSVCILYVLWETFLSETETDSNSVSSKRFWADKISLFEPDFVGIGIWDSVDESFSWLVAETFDVRSTLDRICWLLSTKSECRNDVVVWRSNLFCCCSITWDVLVFFSLTSVSKFVSISRTFSIVGATEMMSSSLLSGLLLADCSSKSWTTLSFWLLLTKFVLATELVSAADLDDLSIRLSLLQDRTCSEKDWLEQLTDTSAAAEGTCVVMDCSTADFSMTGIVWTKYWFSSWAIGVFWRVLVTLFRLSISEFDDKFELDESCFCFAPSWMASSAAEFSIILPSCASCTAQSMEATAASTAAAGSDAWLMGWLSAWPADGPMSPSKGSDLVTVCWACSKPDKDRIRFKASKGLESRDCWNIR